MSFELSNQQKAIINEMLDPTDDILSIESVAGASKTYTMIKAAKALYERDNNVKIRYLVFGRIAADEAKTQFGYTAIVSNINQLAYAYVMSGSNLYMANKPFVTWRDIPKYIKQPYGKTYDSIMLMNDFFKSRYLTFTDFMKHLHYQVDNETEQLAKDIITAMYSGTMGLTHDAYMKLFHSGVVNGSIELDPVDVLIVDEANDLNQITLDIFKHYPAKLRVLIGDSHQEIFNFMGTINAFDEFPNAKKLELTQSFRCCTQIAKQIEKYGKTLLDPNFRFEGFEYDKSEIKTKAYITRTNSEIIAKIIDLKEQGVSFKLASDAKVDKMFEVPMKIVECNMNTNYKGRFYDLQQAVKRYYQNETEMNKYDYLIEKLNDDVEIVSAVKLLKKYGTGVVVDVYQEVKHEKHINASYTLITAHSSKGLTFDEITLSQGLNEVVDEIVENILYNNAYELNKSDINELNLYYVAVSRARFKVNNAYFISDEFFNKIK